MPDQGCTHIGAIATIKQPQRHECDECVKIGSDWVTCAPARNAAGPTVATAPRIAMQPGTRERPGIPLSRRRSRESAGCIAIPTQPPLSTDNSTGGVAGASVPESTRHAAELR
jgi:hypothetical protein